MAYLLILASCLNSFSGSAYDALVTEYTNIENRQAAFSLLYMGLNIGASIAPIIGGFLLERHMRILFYGDAVTTFMAVSLILLFVKDRFSRQEMSDHMEKHEEEMKESVFSVLKKTPILIVFALITSIYSFVYQQFGFGIPLGMDEVFGSRGAGLFGMLSSVNGLMVIFLTPFLIHLTKKMKIKNVLAVAGACYAGAFLAVGVSTAFAGYVIAIVLLTLGEILCMVNMATFIANLSKKTHLARINSVVSIIREVGSCISPIVIGALLDFITIQEAFLIIAVIAVIGAGFMLLLKETKEEEVYTLIDN